jgi:protoheme IX farnesyltransferase
MSLFLRYPIFKKAELLSSPFSFYCSSCCLQLRCVSSSAPSKKQRALQKNISKNSTTPKSSVGKLDDVRLNTANVIHDLRFDTPPVLFIKKYKEVIDTQDLVFKDELNEIEKSSIITPETLTQKKIKYIQDAIRQSRTFEKLSEKLSRKPDPILTPIVTSGEEIKRSVFTDSDFETIRTESVQGLQKQDDFQPEWNTTNLQLSDLHKHYLNLSKARLTLLVCMTATAGYGMAPVPFDPYIALCATLGTAMASAAANSINQILEVPFDSQMNRTKNRVLVRGCVSSLHAFMFASVMAGAGTILLYTQVNGLCAALSLLNLVLYTSVYTPMKRVSILNTWVGSIVGAIPPLIGWSAATGGLEPGAFILAAILYSWQFPHFNSLSWNLRPDYSKAGYRMMSVTHPDLCRRVALRHSAACIAICTMAPVLGVTTWAFAMDSLVLNVYLTYLAYRFYEKADSNSSRKLFRFSLIHLPLLMTFMWISKKSPNDEKDSFLPNFIQS